MKRITTLLVCVLSVATLWAYYDVNNYASDLSFPNGATMTQNHTINVKFLVQAPTKGVWVYLDKDRNGSFETEIYSNPNLVIDVSNKENLTYGTVTCTLPNDIAPGEYRWAVKVKGSQDHSSWTKPRLVRNEDWKRYVFREAMDVAVDCSYESAYLGYSYVIESQGGSTTTIYRKSYEDTYSRTTKDGIYIFDSYMSQFKDYGNPYTGGVTWDATSNYKERGPFSVCVDDEGYVYVSENRPGTGYPDGILVRRMHPSDLTKSMQVVLTQSDLDNLNKRIHSIAVTRDANGNKVLYGIFGGTDDGALTSGKIGKFTINDSGNSITVTQNSAVNLFDDGLISIYTSIIPGKKGDVWIFQHRGDLKKPKPSLIHLNSELTVDFNLISDDISRFNLRGSGALSPDGSILALPIHKAVSNQTYTTIRFYRVTYDNTNVPSLTELTSMDLQVPIMQTSSSASSVFIGNEMVEGMAFDVANNLYIVSGNANTDKEGRYVDKLYVYGLPKTENSHTTPARSALPIIVPGKEIIWHPYPSKPASFATDADYANWIATTFFTAVTPGYTPPTITRDGYILAGWYYGNATTYDITDAYDKNNPKGGHLWARWIKATFEEGYLTASLAEDSYSRQEIEAGKVNRNMELVSCLLQNPSYLPSNLKVNRKLQGGMYNTFMLPFALTTTLRENIIDSEGQPLAEDAILTMQNVTSHTTNGETLYELVFASASEVPAYQPFLIKPTNDLTATMTFPNVSAVEPLPVQPAAEIEGVRFVPVFEPTMMGGEESNILILVADNRLAKLNGVGEMLGLRGYFDTGDALSSASYVMKIVDKNGVVTYIGDVTAPQKGSVATKILHNGQIYILRGNEVYTLSGRRVK